MSFTIGCGNPSIWIAPCPRGVERERPNVPAERSP
jgi:hypothetical protein